MVYIQYVVTSRNGFREVSKLCQVTKLMTAGTQSQSV